MTQTMLFLKSGYQSRTMANYYADVHDDGTVWQPEVYPLAATLARGLQCNYIIDIGCGRANKLASLYPEFEIIGVDFGSNLKYCRETYFHGTWIEANLETAGSIDIPASILKRSVIICSDVIEHLVNPIPLLTLIRSLLSVAAAAVISTPERDLERGPMDYGPPLNPTHVREWNLRELQALLGHNGLQPIFSGLTISNNRTMERKTSLAVISGHDLTPYQVSNIPNVCLSFLEHHPQQNNNAEYAYGSQLDQLEAELASAQRSRTNNSSEVDIINTTNYYINAGRYHEAFVILDESQKKNHDHPLILFNLGRIATEWGLSDYSKEFFLRAIKKSPEMTEQVIDFYAEQLSKSC